MTIGCSWVVLIYEIRISYILNLNESQYIYIYSKTHYPFHNWAYLRMGWYNKASICKHRPNLHKQQADGDRYWIPRWALVWLTWLVKWFTWENRGVRTKEIKNEGVDVSCYGCLVSIHFYTGTDPIDNLFDHPDTGYATIFTGGLKASP